MIDPKTDIVTCDTEGCGYAAVLQHNRHRIVLPPLWRFFFLYESKPIDDIDQNLKEICPLCAGSIEHALEARRLRREGHCG